MSFENDISYEKENRDICTTFYKDIFGDLLQDINVIEDRELQYKGIDVILTLVGGKKIYVDEKVRRTNYGDFLIEILSNEETKREGWSYHYFNDYVLYVFVDQKRAYFVPQLLLSLLVRNNLDAIKNCKEIKAENRNRDGSLKYKTVSKIVLFEDLFKLFSYPYEI